MESVQERRETLEARYPEWVPRTLSQMLDHLADAHPDRPFVITDDRIFTYAEMRDWSERLALGLASSGVRPRDNVAVIMANYPEFVALKFAIARAGAVTVPINFQFRRDELGYVLEQSDSTLLITMNRFRDLDYVEALDELATGWEQRGGGDRFPKLREIFIFTTDENPRVGAQSLEDLASRSSKSKSANLERGKPDDLSDIVFTSGTTGRPKGVMITHDMLLRTAYASAYTRAFNDGRRILFALPMYHVFGYVEGLLATLIVGGAVAPQIIFDPVDTLGAIEQHQVDEVMFVPTMTLAVLDVAREKSFDLSSLSAVFSSGGQSPVWIWEDVKKVLGAEELFTAYGMTETTASTTCVAAADPIERLVTGQGRLKPAGVAGDPELGGHLALHKIVDLETGAEVPPGTEGEIIGFGPIISKGYYKKPEETAAAFDSEGWLHTGDLGLIDKDGYISLTGRAKDCYRCGGEMVVPKEVEDVLLDYPGVMQAHVVPIPNERMGEVGVAWVVFEEEAPENLQELIDLCSKRLARFKVPAHVFPITQSDLPTSASGKVQKFKLVERSIKELEAAAGGGGR